jgi:hypothetical protein
VTRDIARRLADERLNRFRAFLAEPRRVFDQAPAIVKRELIKVVAAEVTLAGKTLVLGSRVPVGR